MPHKIHTDFASSVPETVKHYLRQIGHILELVSKEDDAEHLLASRLAPDFFETGFQFAVAIRFAARALCPPCGMAVPDIAEVQTLASLQKLHEETTALIHSIQVENMSQSVVHVAGEANLRHDPAEYVTSFALPNLLFHLSMGYAGLRQNGVKIGKADFDGYHVYS